MSDRIVLDIDVGNTRVKWRMQIDDHHVHGHHIHAAGREDAERWPDANIGRIRISSVASSDRNSAIAQSLHSRYGVVAEFARTAASVGNVRCGYLDPSTMGVDRWLAILAGRNLANGAYVVADLGTAATVDCVDDTSAHQGGYIAPGTHLMTQALLRNTARIRVSYEDLGTQMLAPAKTTASAVRNGILMMLVQFVAGSYSAFQRQVGGAPALILCGGDADLVSPRLNVAHRIEPDLVLDGLSIALP